MFKIAIDFLFKPRLFKPTHTLNSFQDLLPLAQDNQAEMVILDKDDTLTSLHSFTVTDPSIKNTLQSLKERKVKLYVLSNSIKSADPQSIEGIPILRFHKKKPFNVEQTKQLIGKADLSKVWIVGDRLMTDVYLANQIGCRSALVPPVEASTISKHGFSVVYLRKLEQLFLRFQ